MYLGNLFLLPAALFFFSLATSYAQMEIGLTSPRQNFLLYEPILLDVEVKNTSSESFDLDNHSSPWLSFLVFKDDGTKIPADLPFPPPSRKLEPGTAVSFPVNITPWYRIRETGQYRVQAAVQLPDGSSLMSQPLTINVGMGGIVWNDNHSEKGRAYSLIRFVDQNQPYLYLRVEEPSNNIVYGSPRLGPVNPALPLAPPQFDNQGRLHILHSDSATSRCYTVVNAEGQILSSESFAIADFIPQLVQDEQGAINVTGRTIPDPLPLTECSEGSCPLQNQKPRTPSSLSNIKRGSRGI
ncbi:MAG: hypothetical protein V1746_01895 [bacterium]